MTDDHWFIQARKTKSTANRAQRRAERFFVYDPELNQPLTIRLEGGPDRYKVFNAAKFPLNDVLILAADAKGHRLGWIDELPAAKAAAGAKPEAKPTSPPTAEAKSSTGEVTATVATPAAPAPAHGPAVRPRAAGRRRCGCSQRPAKSEPEKPAIKPPETSADVEMGPVLSDEQLASQGTAELRKRLAAAGLSESDIDLMLSLYADAFFKSKEMVILFRVPQGTIDEWMPLEVDPDNTKITRWRW